MSLKGFTETKKHIVLMCTNVLGNNNKFYSLELQYNPTSGKYRLYSHYGRINGSVISGGQVDDDKEFNDEFSANKEFESIVKKKKKGKTKLDDSGQKYTEKYDEVQVAASTVGSENVRTKATTNATTKSAIKKDLFTIYGKKESELLTLFQQENIHEITSVTSLKVNSGILSTPLGPLTIEHLIKAKKALDDLASLVSVSSSITKDLKDLNSRYFSLIPRNFGSIITDSSLLKDQFGLNKEYDLINQMETAVSLNNNSSDDSNKLRDIFTIQTVSNELFKEIKHYVDSTRKHNNLKSYNVVGVYQVENFKERNRFELFADKLQKENTGKKVSKFDYDEIDVFHGSRNSNILSILLNGFYVPPANASFVHGRMFGNGVYGADSSTKALNYSVGNWSGVRNKSNKTFLFVTRFAMGKVKETTRELKSGCPAGYNSIFASGGYDLVNNEFIVPKVEQTTISYLVELE